jgi:hypothetical protein
MTISELTRAEAQFKKILLTTQGSFEVRYQQALKQAPELAVPETPPAAQHMPPALLDAPLSAPTYRQIYLESHSRELPSERVTQAHIDEARGYVQDLFDVDLSRVDVEVLPNSQWNDDRAEATHFKSGIDEHLILIPEVCPCPPSELLVHEFGHAGHVTAQRETPEYEFFWVTAMTAEFPAHFCQYSFILDRLSRADFMQSMLQVVTSTYALAVLKADALDSLESFWMSEPAKAIRQAWSEPELLHTFKLFQKNRAYFFDECRRGVSQMLALTLIDRREEMRRFIRLDRLDRGVAEKLKEAFPNDPVTAGFAGINEQFSSLLARFRR